MGVALTTGGGQLPNIAGTHFVRDYYDCGVID